MWHLKMAFHHTVSKLPFQMPHPKRNLRNKLNMAPKCESSSGQANKGTLHNKNKAKKHPLLPPASKNVQFNEHHQDKPKKASILPTPSPDPTPEGRTLHILDTGTKRSLKNM
jgi:hypothetical protein